MTQESSWVWYSTRESIQAEKISVLACVETLCAVAASLALAAWTGFYWQIALSLLIAPLVLLQSEASVREAYERFRTFYRGYREPKKWEVWLWAGISFAIAGVACFFLAKFWLSDVTVWAAFWRSFGLAILAMNIALAVAGMGGVEAVAVAGAAAIAGAVVGAVAGAAAVAAAVAGAVAVAVAGAGALVLVVWPGFCFGLFLRSLFERLRAVFFHFRPGVRRLPQNWARTVLMMDSLRAPQLVASPEDEDDAFSLSNLLVDQISVRKDTIDRVASFLAYILVPLICLPSLLYRWSIKSTFWLYAPVLYLAYLPKHHSTPEGLLVWMRATPQTLLEKWRIFLALITIATAAGSYVNWQQALDLYAGLRAHEMTFTAMNIFFVLDYQKVTWLQMVQLASAAITIGLLFTLNQLRIEEKHGRELDMSHWQMQLIYYAFRLRGALGVVAVMFGLWYFAQTWCVIKSDCAAGVGPFLLDQAALLWPFGGS